METPFVDWTELLIEDVLNGTLPVEIFDGSKSRDYQIKVLKDRFIRFNQYAVAFGWIVLELNQLFQLDLTKNAPIQMPDDQVVVPVDAIIELPDGNCLLLNFEMKGSPFAIKNSSVDPHANVWNSLELFCLQLAAEQYAVTCGKKSIAGLVYLKSRQDKTGRFESKFQAKKNDNLVVYNFDQEDRQALYGKIRENLIRTTFEKCPGKRCESCSVSAICQYEPEQKLPAQPVADAVKASKSVEWTLSQLSFIEFESGICRCNAVAGAGKTTVIVNRFINLLKKGYSPEGFLLITFTEKGVQELREKMEYWLIRHQLSPQLASKMAITTFNGLGGQLIETYYDRLGYQKKPTLIDRMEAIKIIRLMAQNHELIPGYRYDYPFMNLNFAKGVYFELLENFSQLKMYEYAGQTTVSALMGATSLSLEVVNLYKSYRAYCREHHLIDFDDQIAFALELLEDSDIVNKLSYSHVVVDEFQDTNNDQLAIIQSLIDHKFFCSLMVCGDDSQAIYGFRGADQGVLLEFHDIFEDVIDIQLEDNFRTTREIAALANAFNGLNQDRVEKNIVAHKSGVQPIFVNNDVLQLELGESVERQVEKSLIQGIPLSQIAIIGRTRKELIEIKNYLIEKEIPALMVVSEKLKDQPAVQRFISLARYLKDRVSEPLLCEFLQFNEFESFQQAAHPTAWFALKIEEFKAIYEPKTEVERWAYVMELLTQAATQHSACAKLLDVVKSHNFERFTQLLDFLDELDLYDSDLSIMPDESVEAVVLTTAHASKGREYTVVICLTNTFKKPSSKLDKESFRLQLEEERRLLYVAITRAKEVLILMKGRSKESYYHEELLALNKQIAI